MRSKDQKGTMQLVRRKSGLEVWIYRWFEPDPAGRSQRSKRVVGPLSQFSTEKKAWAEVERLGLGQSFDKYGPRNLKELADHYTKHELDQESKEARLSFSTKDNYRYYLRKWIVPRWGFTALSDIKSLGVEDWLASLSRTNREMVLVELAPGTKKKIRDLMHVLFEHAIRNEWTTRNPITSVRQGSKRQSVPALLTVEQLSMLLFQSLELRERVMVFLDFGTGMRRGELSGVKWEDIDFANQQVNVCRSIVKQRIGPTKTEASQKPIPLDEYLMDDLKRWRQESPYWQDADYVFASVKMKGKQPYWLSRIMQHHIKPAAAKLGFEIKGWHTLRHTYSTLLKANGNDPKVVQELLRHASFQITMDTYTQAMTDDKRRAHRDVIRLVVPRQVPLTTAGNA